MDYRFVVTPLGDVLLTATNEALTGLHFVNEKYYPEIEADWVEKQRQPILRETADQLKRYFKRTLSVFDLPLAAEGTPFQHRVWRELVRVPYGETRSYGQIASRLGLPQASRAVGAANGRNPISIVVPCHRVIGADGSLTGYAGGMDRKTKLLQLEGALRNDLLGAPQRRVARIAA